MDILEFKTLAQIRSPLVQSLEDEVHIQKAHGPFVMTQKNNVLFDLRNYYEKPFWGHSHPLFIFNHDVKADLSTIPSLNSKAFKLINCIDHNDAMIKNPIKGLQELLSSTENHEEKFYLLDQSTQLVLNPSKNYAEVNNNSQNSFLKLIKLFYFSYLEGQRLQRMLNLLTREFTKTDLLTIKLSKDITQKDLLKKGIYVSEKNYSENSLDLFLPLSITDQQILELKKRIEE